MPRPAAGGVVVCGRRVLLIGKRANGEWRLPKGGIWTGEQPEVCAAREVCEETGFCDLRLATDLGTQTVEYRLDGHLVRRELTFYRFELASPARCPRGGDEARRFEVRWFEAEDALAALSFESERTVLRAALGTCCCD